jgi:pyrroloquinoline-quinone synthase
MHREVIENALVEARRTHRLLEHPFYQAWQAGTLSEDDLAFYSTQYWRQVEAFPSYLEDVSDRLEPGRARDIVEANLRDEKDDDHPGLWLDFVAALGVKRDEVRASAPERETKECVATFLQACAQADLPYALGMLYGYESQTPEVAETKVSGLKEHYGIEGPAARYFALHGELDVEHARELADALSDVIEDEADLDRARAGARAGAEAIYGLLDGVARVREIAAPV